MELDYTKQGDCLELMKEIPDKSVDMILCDLPYGTTYNKWDVIIPFEKMWKNYERIIKDNGAIVLFSAEPFTSRLVLSNIKLFRYDLIWEKSQGSDFLNARRKPLRVHENICVFYKKQPTYNPQKTAGKPYKTTPSDKQSSNYGKINSEWFTENKDGMRFPLTITRFSSSTNGNKYHPTQKPVALLEYLIKTYTNEGELILDNCMGSGSTCVAAINTDRHYIGFELEKEYFDIANDRIAKAKGCLNENKGILIAD